MFRLVANSSAPGWDFQLKPGLNTLGRGGDNDFQIDHPSISTRHCQFRVGPAAIHLEDLGSTNGTYVDGGQVMETYVQPGQLIRCGNIELRIEIGEAATVASAVTSAAAVSPTGPPRGGPVRVDLASVKQSAGAAPTPAAAKPAAAQIVATVAPAPTEVVEIDEDKPTFCRNHYHNLARFECPKCRHFFCDLCVNTRGSSAGGMKFCKVCGVECRPVAVKPITKPTDFFESLRPAFKYPFVGDGWFLLLGGFIFFGFLDLANYIARNAFTYAMRAMMMRAVAFTFILGTGYLFSYLKKIIACTIEGEEQMPDWPELSEWKDDIVVPMFQFTIIALLSFSPALILYLWWDGDNMWFVWLVALLGCVYFPMAWLGVAIFDTLAALNPMFVVGSIVRVPREYGVAAGVFAAILGLRWLSESLLSWIMHIPVVPALLADLFAIVLLMVEARILGLLYRSQKPILGWLHNR